MKKGKFVISLDTEIAWGWLPFEEKRKSFYPLYEKTREVIDRLIVLFEKYDIPATWAIVGKMIEKEDSRNRVLEIADFFPHLSNKKINNDPELNKKENPYLVAPDIIEKIIASKVQHEIATHSYHHIHFGRYGKEQRALVEKDIDAFLEVFDSYDRKIESIVFPRNDIGFVDLLSEKGLRNYRGIDKVWYANWPSPFKKILQPLDGILPTAPEVVDPIENPDGMINIPGSMLFRIRHFGIRKNIPVGILKTKGIKGLEAAVRKNKIFHLWFHPFNFGYKMDEHLNAFEAVLSKAAELRKSGQLDTVCMKDINPK